MPCHQAAAQLPITEHTAPVGVCASDTFALAGFVCVDAACCLCGVAEGLFAWHCVICATQCSMMLSLVISSEHLDCLAQCGCWAGTVDMLSSLEGCVSAIL